MAITCHPYSFLPQYVAAALLPYDDPGQTPLPVRQLHFFACHWNEEPRVTRQTAAIALILAKTVP